MPTSIPSRAAWLLSRLLLRTWRLHPLRQGLTALSVALGVALFVSTQLTADAIFSAVEHASSALDAGVDLVVSRDVAGVSEESLEQLRARPEFAAASGVVQVEAQYERRLDLTLFGVDPEADRAVRGGAAEVSLAEVDVLAFLTDRSAVALTRGLLRLLGRSVGDSIDLSTAAGVKTFRVAAAIEVPPEYETAALPFGFLPLASAQELFGRRGFVDRVDVALAPGVDLERGVDAARLCVDAAAVVQTTGERLGEQTAALDGFRGILVVSGLIALLVAIFFVFNTASAAMAERTRDAGMWRALGLTRGGLLALLAGEAAVLGLLGFAGGLFLGRGVANLTVDTAASIVNQVHFRVPPIEGLALAPRVVAESLLLALGAALLASLLAGLSLLRRPPLESLSPLRASQRGQRSVLRSAAVGAALLALSVGFAAFHPGASRQYVGRVTALTLPAGFALLAPAAVAWIAAAARRSAFARLPPAAWLALDAVRAHPARTALTVTAFALSLGLMIGQGAVLRGMHETLSDWLRRAVPGDVLIAGSSTVPLAMIPFREEAVAPLRELPGVEDVFRMRFGRTRVNGVDLVLVAFDIAVARKRADYRFLAGERESVLDATERCEGVFIAENLQWNQGIGVGDSIEIAAARGIVRLPVLGVIQDFHDPNGAVFLDLALYRRLFEDDLIAYAELLVAPGADVDAVAAAAKAAIPPQFLFLGVSTKQDFMALALGFVDDVKRLGLAQLVLALLVGAVGMLVTVSLSILDRTRELALLRAIGMDARRLGHTVAWEVALLSAASGAVGAIIGGLFFLPADFVVREMSGFSFDYRWPWQETALAAALTAATALVAVLWPLRHARRLRLLDAIAAE